MSTAISAAVVVAAHRSGVPFLKDLLTSFGGFASYPIHLVVMDYTGSDELWMEDVMRRFAALRLRLHRERRNGFELGALHAVYSSTSYDELLLLPHSCELVDAPGLLRQVFEEHRGKSVAFALQEGVWSTTWNALSSRDRRLVGRYLQAEDHRRLLAQGTVRFWHAHIGKYRRAILDRLALETYVPENMLQAITLSEVGFTSAYHAADPESVELFPGWDDASGTLEERHGRLRRRIANSYVIKWKTHWEPSMVIQELRGSGAPELLLRGLRKLGRRTRRR